MGAGRGALGLDGRGNEDRAGARGRRADPSLDRRGVRSRALRTPGTTTRGRAERSRSSSPSSRRSSRPTSSARGPHPLRGGAHSRCTTRGSRAPWRAASELPAKSMRRRWSWSRWRRSEFTHIGDGTDTDRCDRRGLARISFVSRTAANIRAEQSLGITSGAARRRPRATRFGHADPCSSATHGWA